MRTLSLPAGTPATKVNWSVVATSETTRVGLLVLASVLPSLALWNKATYLFGDSYQYLRAALTFAQGDGLYDMSGNAFTFFTPFYPLVIGIAHRVTPNVNIETTARLVSLAGATTAVIALYWLLRVRYSRWISFSVSLLFALLPLRVWSSLWALSEGLYLGLLMLGLAVIFVPTKRSWLVSALGGILLGLAYLTRPEAILCVFAIVALPALRVFRGQKKSFAILAGFLLVAVPYHARVYQLTDGMTSGRLSLLWAQSEAFRQGKGPQFAYSHQIDNQSLLVQQHKPDLSVRAVSSRYVFFARWEVQRLLHNLGPYWIVLGLLVVGGPLLVARRARLSKGITFSDTWQFVLPLMLLVLPLLHIEDRYLLQAMPVFLLWLVLIIAAVDTFVAARLRSHSQWLTRLVPLAFMGVFVLSYGYRLATQIPQRDSSVLARSTAHWLEAQKSSPARILSQTPDVAFFANGVHLWMPGGEADSVLRYAEQNGVRYLYVSSQDVPTPLNVLLLGDRAQIPSSLELLHEESDGPARCRLFELKSTDHVISSNLHL